MGIFQYGHSPASQAVPGSRTHFSMGARSIGSVALMVVLCFTSACTPYGTAANLTWKVVDAATQERGFVGAIDDLVVQGNLNSVFASNSNDLFMKTTTTVHEGRVLMTGVVSKEQDRVLATTLAWQVDGVRDVINALDVGNPDGVNTVRDMILAERFEDTLMLDMDISSRNYRARVVGSRLHLLGVAHDQKERDLVMAYGRACPGIRVVEDHTRLVADGEPLRPSSSTSLAELYSRSQLEDPPLSVQADAGG